MVFEGGLVVFGGVEVEEDLVGVHFYEGDFFGVGAHDGFEALARFGDGHEFSHELEGDNDGVAAFAVVGGDGDEGGVALVVVDDGFYGFLRAGLVDVEDEG